MKIDKIVCPECGTSIKKSTVRNLFRGPVCPSCGIEITELLVIPKSKTVAVVLAVFFGFWSWLYTYRKDRIKFWSCLGLMIVIGVAWGTIFNMIIFWIFASINFVGWISALVDAVRRSKSFFLDYPNG